MPVRAQTSAWESDVMSRLAGGDEGALAEVFDQFASFVYGLAVRVTRDRAAAEDVTQEVFVRLWEHPERFDPDRGSLRAWLGTLAHRRAVDHVRREQAIRRRSEREASLPAPPPDIEELATALALAGRVRAAVDGLPADQRRAVELAYFGGRTYRQVAVALGIPEGTAKSRLRIGLRRVAAALESQGITA